MVSLTANPTVHDIRNAILAASKDDAEQPIHWRIFAAWMQLTDKASKHLLIQLSEDAAKATGPRRQSMHVAVLGYAMQATDTYSSEFISAVEWLSKRQYFIGPASFEYDGIAILGVAVGLQTTSALEGANYKSWLVSLAEKSLQAYNHDAWTAGLIAAAIALLTDLAGSPAHAGRQLPDLKIALMVKGLLNTEQQVREVAWREICSLVPLEDGFTRAACDLAAFDYLLARSSTIRFDGISTHDVVIILQGIERSLRLWTWEAVPRTPKSAIARWDVENEYHVQNLVWTVLAPLFPDLDDEEWLKSLGQHHPRGDFAIPSLELIVEIKFARGTTPFSKLIAEVAADASTYLQAGSGYNQIIVFVWDDLARTEEHAEFKQGLRRLPGIVDAIVVSRPSKMVREKTQRP